MGKKILLFFENTPIRGNSRRSRRNIVASPTKGAGKKNGRVVFGQIGGLWRAKKKDDEFLNVGEEPRKRRPGPSTWSWRGGFTAENAVEKGHQAASEKSFQRGKTCEGYHQKQRSGGRPPGTRLPEKLITKKRKIAKAGFHS